MAEAPVHRTTVRVLVGSQHIPATQKLRARSLDRPLAGRAVDAPLPILLQEFNDLTSRYSSQGFNIIAFPW